MNKLIKTSDGSHTIYVPGLDEHYHSIHGAVQESSHIFINNGFDVSEANPLRILEIGFGTGLNALLTAMRASKGTRVVQYTSLEKYPLDNSLLQTLNHHEFAGENGGDLFRSIHSAEWNKVILIRPNFSLRKMEMDFTKDVPAGAFDLIYFDAFGPDKQPEMWTHERFLSIASVTDYHGILVTYSAKGEVKRTLKACGFDVQLLPGPPGKRQMIRAVKN
jgi:tRNA U34 5-methylaminomethyl-2-thiouridine-forming methyltransferase MnmC